MQTEVISGRKSQDWLTVSRNVTSDLR
jgi:hypothetical protein